LNNKESKQPRDAIGGRIFETTFVMVALVILEGMDRLRAGKATPRKSCARWWQARRARSDAPYQRRARAMAFQFHCRLRSSGLAICHYLVGFNFESGDGFPLWFEE
jgi:hypothetical protein